jgi:hypothetical protein
MRRVLTRGTGIAVAASIESFSKIKIRMINMETLVMAAAGYSLVYLLAGGGLFGAIVIFFVAKALGK